MADIRMDPNDPCSTCAFGKAGGAADESANRLKGLICAHAAIPFFCHHKPSGEEIDWRGDAIAPLSHPPSERRICAGWKAMVRRTFKHGGHMDWRLERPQDGRELRRYQRQLGTQAIGQLGIFLHEKDPAIKRRARLDLKSTLRALFNLGGE